jgi:phospholipase/carboxylesterase
MAPTLVSLPHSRALFLPEGIGDGPPEAFHRGRKFAHIHPHHDSSLYLILSEHLKDEVEAARWGIRHPDYHPILVYGPRDRDELEVVWATVQASYALVLGNDASPGARP